MPRYLSAVPIDPMDIVRAEGGPYHTRRHLPEYLDRLRATGRGHWADVLLERHPAEADPATWDHHPTLAGLLRRNRR